MYCQSLEILTADVRKWKTKKEWYEAVNEIHDKKAKIENEIVWAQVEEYEKAASEALKKKEDQLAQIEMVCFHYFLWIMNYT